MRALSSMFYVVAQSKKGGAYGTSVMELSVCTVSIGSAVSLFMYLVCSVLCFTQLLSL